MPEQRRVRLFRNGHNQPAHPGHAYATGATVVTANIDEFKPIRGLEL
jgi:hypothetical protein